MDVVPIFALDNDPRTMYHSQVPPNDATKYFQVEFAGMRVQVLEVQLTFRSDVVDDFQLAMRAYLEVII